MRLNRTRFARGIVRAAAFCCVGFIVCSSGLAVAQGGAQSNEEREGFGLKLAVDEVEVTFHAEDAQGLPLNDLKLREIKLLDNEKPPEKILAFNAITERPLRAGILVDNSESMFSEFPRIKAIAVEFAQHLFRHRTDQAFVMDFAFTSETVQAWTGDPGVLARSVGAVKAGTMNSRGGTALFDALFRACQYDFASADPSATGNFIMLFSDGGDNAGRTTPEEALKACQRSNTAIYAFRPRPVEGTNPDGTAILTALTSKSGGWIFDAEGDLESVFADLRVIESDLRNQYRLVYRPSNFKHDGSFHTIVMETPDREAKIQVRTGYYAPAQ